MAALRKEKKWQKDKKEKGNDSFLSHKHFGMNYSAVVLSCRERRERENAENREKMISKLLNAKKKNSGKEEKN